MQPASPQLRTAPSREGSCLTAPPTVLPTELTVEWNTVCHEQCNVLVEARPAVVEQLLRALRPHLRYPIREYCPKDGISVMQPAEGSLLLLEVASLLPSQQEQLLRWLDACTGRFTVQLASTSSVPLFPFVEAGAFDASLYYRLNTVRMAV